MSTEPTDAGSSPSGSRPTGGLAPLSHMVSWLELFYDLVFVAATLILSVAISKAHHYDANVAWIVITFAALWWAWLSTAMFANRFRVYDLPQRLLVLLQMILVVVVAIEARAGVLADGRSTAWAYGLLMGSIALMYARCKGRPSPQGPYARRMATTYGVGAVLFLLDSQLPELIRPWVGAAAIAIIVVPVVIRANRRTGVPPLDEGHLVERMGAFTLIVLGETFIKVAIAVSANHVSGIDVGTLITQFLITFSLWTSYFEDVPHAGLLPRRLGGWTGAHLVMQMGMVTTAIGVAKLIELTPDEHLSDADTIEIIASISVIYVALAAVSWCTRRQPLRALIALRLGTAGAVALLGVTTWTVTSVHMDEVLPLVVIVMIVNALGARRIIRSTTFSAASPVEHL